MAKETAETKPEFEPTKHRLVPKHVIVNDKELKIILKKYEITIDDLPRISHNDPAIIHMGLEDGDVIKVERDSPTAGHTVFYRRVI